jgi:hypothetical protein
MKNLIVYYLAIVLPIPLLIWISMSNNPILFTILILIYAIPYRTLIDGIRLVNKGLIKWDKIWKLLIPGQRLEYTKDLYFKK